MLVTKPIFYDATDTFCCALCDDGDITVEPCNQRGDPLTCPDCGAKLNLWSDDTGWMVIPRDEYEDKMDEV